MPRPSVVRNRRSSFPALIYRKSKNLSPGDARIDCNLRGSLKASGLSKAGLAIFEVVYHQIRQIRVLNDRTCQRGLQELLDKESLFRSSPRDRLPVYSGKGARSTISQKSLG